MNVHATRGRKRGLRQTYSMVCDPALIAELEEMVASGVYRSRSHAIESAVRLLIAYHRMQVPALPAEVPDAA